MRQCLNTDTHNIYWIENPKENYYEFSVYSADLQGNNRKSLYSEKQLEYIVPTLMVVSKDFIYWVNTIEKSIWQLPRNSSETNLIATEIEVPFTVYGMAINYKIEDQKDSAVTVSGKSVCECAQGYTGERCEVSVCHNYCFRGDCSVSAEGQPKCR